MNKQEIYDYLNAKKLWYEMTEHKAVYNMDELSQIDLPYPEADAKNLFIRDAKKENYYLITVQGNKRVNLKEFRKNNGTGPLSFASEKELMDLLELTPGAVTPFGLLNDRDSKVIFFLDQSFLKEGGLIGVHPNDNRATVWLKVNDLIEIIKAHGNQVKIVSL